MREKNPTFLLDIIEQHEWNCKENHSSEGHLSYKNTTLLHRKFTVINRWLKSASQARECFQVNIWVCLQAATAANISPLENILPFSDMVVQAERGWSQSLAIQLIQSQPGHTMRFLKHCHVTTYSQTQYYHLIYVLPSQGFLLISPTCDLVFLTG